MRRLALALCVLGGCKAEPVGEAPPASAAPKPEVAVTASPLFVPQEEVWAASAHLRVVDVGAGQVVAGIDLQRSIMDLVFTPDGRRLFVAASDGVREVDPEARKVVRKLTDRPARRLTLGPEGKRLFVLQHEVVRKATGQREVKPFEVVTFDVESRKRLTTSVVGPRVFAAYPGTPEGLQHLIVTEAGTVHLGSGSFELSKLTTLVLPEAVREGYGVRPYIVLSRDHRHAYIPMEGAIAHVLVVDRQTGTARALPVERPMLMRGLGLTPDGQHLVVNGARYVTSVELKTGKVVKTVSLAAAHTGVALGPQGRLVYLAQTIDEDGGAISIVDLSTGRFVSKIHLDDISPWAIAVRPKSLLAEL